MTKKITKVRTPAITLGLTDEQIHWWAVGYGLHPDHDPRRAQGHHRGRTPVRGWTDHRRPQHR
jgi:hypothetical protein